MKLNLLLIFYLKYQSQNYICPTTILTIVLKKSDKLLKWKIKKYILN